MTNQPPRLFTMERSVDVTGASGTGTVADGVIWPDGTVSIRWRGDRPSTVFWDSIEDAEWVHGHGGATRFVWVDEQMTAALTSLIEGKNAELKRHHLAARIGDLKGSAISDIRWVLDGWNVDDPALENPFRALWHQVHDAAKRYDSQIAEISAEADRDIPGLDAGDPR